MANECKISIKDRDSAISWLNNVTLINEEYHGAMKEAGETVTDVENFAEGTMVDELVDAGHKILSAAETTFNAINAIADTVNNVLDTLGAFADKAIGLFGKVAGIFGG